jgi:hypothetical protein
MERPANNNMSGMKKLDPKKARMSPSGVPPTLMKRDTK